MFNETCYNNDTAKPYKNRIANRKSIFHVKPIEYCRTSELGHGVKIPSICKPTREKGGAYQRGNSSLAFTRGRCVTPEKCDAYFSYDDFIRSLSHLNKYLSLRFEKKNNDVSRNHYKHKSITILM